MNLVCKRFFFILWVLLWLFFNISGGILIKYSAVYHDRYKLLLVLFILLLGTFGARASISLIMGQYYQLSYVYPFLGLNYIFSVIIGIVLFDEQIIGLRFWGCAMILGGVSLLLLSQNKNERGNV